MQRPTTELGSVTLRPLTAKDAPFVDALCRERIGQEFQELLADAPALGNLVAMQAHAQDVSYRTQFPGASHSLIQVEGQPIGRLILHSTEESLHLVDVCITNTFRGRGVGTYVMSLLQETARSLGLPLTLSARRGSQAERLYQRLGFATTDAQVLDVAMSWPGEQGAA